MGVSGSGKTTMGRLIAESLRMPFIDADSLHPDSNLEKMRNGIPLTDEDRMPWLMAVNAAATNARTTGLVVACSALKREYRDFILSNSPRAIFVYLKGSRHVLSARLQGRTDHFMSADLLDSQLAILEPLTDEEPGTVVNINASIQEVLAEALSGIDHTAQWEAGHDHGSHSG
ncbi:MAG: gluconokinase [Cryobacterium sp.]|nr:gluconokinase [Cryobacterium sp.]